jgi:2-polyprenyl-3-methyl-5-hydroxy-6-metoxy-1,4-benzoquinol methylase
MNDWKPTEEFRRIAGANRRYYSEFASMYEATECCVTDARLQNALEADLDDALAHVGKDPRNVRALDACGGSGNISLKLLRRGVDVTLVDISPELQKIFREKCAATGLVAQVVLSEVGDFLTTTTDTFDLIVFSSALHHLESIEPVLDAAFDRLTPNGVLFTTFDPALQAHLGFVTRLLQRAEYVTFKVFCQPRDLPHAIIRRVKRMATGASPDAKSRVPLQGATAGMLAEYHIERGIDDVMLAKRLETLGYRLIRHDRYVESRFGLTRKLIERTGDVTHFKLLLQKP